jgi:hypothetical protein
MSSMQISISLTTKMVDIGKERYDRDMVLLALIGRSDKFHKTEALNVVVTDIFQC